VELLDFTLTGETTMTENRLPWRLGSNRLTARPFDLFEAGPSAGALDWANCDVQIRIWTDP
jgi:hypothetical protein